MCAADLKTENRRKYCMCKVNQAMAGDELVVTHSVCACTCIAAITCNLRCMKDARMKLKHSHLNACKLRAVNKV